MTPTEVREFLARMPEIWADMPTLKTEPGETVKKTALLRCALNLHEALGIIDFLLAEKSKIRREALEEGMEEAATIADAFAKSTFIRDATRRKIRKIAENIRKRKYRKLAEQPAGKEGG